MDELKNLSLLYAEDDVYIKTLLEGFFTNYFKKVYAVENGQEALYIYTTKKPDVVILDIEMPLLDGLNLAKQIRQHDKQTKIILITAHTEKNILLQAVELGLTTYVEKPVNPVKLQQALQKLSSELSENKNIQLWKHQENNYSWDSLDKELYFNNDILSLTKKEKLLLQAFIHSKQKYLNYQTIYDLVWIEDEDKEFSETAIKTIIKKLRSKLPKNSIKNSYGMGYYLNKNT